MFFDKTDFFYLSSDGIDKNGKKKYSRHVLFAPDRIHIINYSENLYICE